MLARVLARHPYDRETLAALAGYAHTAGNIPDALAYARRLAELDPSNAELRLVVERLGRESGRQRP